MRLMDLKNLSCTMKMVPTIRKIVENIQRTNLISDKDKERIFLKIDALLTKENNEAFVFMKNIQKELDTNSFNIENFIKIRCHKEE